MPEEFPQWSSWELFLPLHPTRVEGRAQGRNSASALRIGQIGQFKLLAPLFGGSLCGIATLGLLLIWNGRLLTSCT